MADNIISFIPSVETDLAIYQGAPITLNCSYTDPTTNDPIDCSGGSMVAEIRASQNKTSTLIATFTTTWVDQSEGTFNLTLTSEQTDAFSFSGSAYWDIFFLDGNVPQNAYPLTYGIVTLQGDISY